MMDFLLHLLTPNLAYFENSISRKCVKATFFADTHDIIVEVFCTTLRNRSARRVITYISKMSTLRWKIENKSFFMVPSVWILYNY